MDYVLVAKQFFISNHGIFARAKFHSKTFNGMNEYMTTRIVVSDNRNSSFVMCECMNDKWNHLAKENAENVILGICGRMAWWLYKVISDEVVVIIFLLKYFRYLDERR